MSRADRLAGRAAIGLWMGIVLGLSGCVVSHVENSDWQMPMSPVDPADGALAPARAAAVGMSAERLERITAMTRRYVDENKLAGVITLVARDGKIVHFETVGQRGVNDPRPLTRDALFRIYSMTKPITAVAAMMLYEEGKFQLSDPVEKFVPELANLNVLVDGELVPAKNKMTMHHLLTHTAGFSYGFYPNDPVDQRYQQVRPLAAKNLDEFVARLGELPLRFEPGERWHYSVAVDVTGLIIERLSGQPFDVFLRQRIFEPLNMVDTFFNVPPDKMHRFLPNHRWDSEQEKLVKLDADPLGDFIDTEMFSGGGGLVSTTMDYLRFAEMVRRGGELDGVRLLSPKTVTYMIGNHLPAIITGEGQIEDPLVRSTRGFGFGLGWGVIKDATAIGVLGSVGEYFWGGAAGTVFWIDPVEDMVVIGMIQLMGSPWPFRAELKVLANQGIVEQR